MHRFMELLTIAAKKSTAAESEPNRATASKMSNAEGDQLQIERASTLDFVRVDEV